jgi:hypothetical protein
MIEALEHAKWTPEARFSYHLLSLMQRLKQKHEAYHHMVINICGFRHLSLTCLSIMQEIIFHFFSLIKVVKSTYFARICFWAKFLGHFFL